MLNQSRIPSYRCPCPGRDLHLGKFGEEQLTEPASAYGLRRVALTVNPRSNTRLIGPYDVRVPIHRVWVGTARGRVTLAGKLTAPGTLLVSPMPDTVPLLTGGWAICAEVLRKWSVAAWYSRRVPSVRRWCGAPLIQQAANGR